MSLLEKLAGSAWLPALLALLSCMLLLPSLTAGFQLDDWFQRYKLLGLGGPAIDLFVFYDGDSLRNVSRMESGDIPWWGAGNLRHASFRYLSVLTMKLDYLLWPDSPELMHAHSLGWLVALVAAVACLYRQILTANVWMPALAALLYAVDDAHFIPAAYIANRSALIASFFGVAALLCYTHAEYRHRFCYRVLCALLLACSLAAAEIGVSTLAYLFAYTLFIDRGTWRSRIAQLVLPVCVFLIWVMLYKFGEFGASGSGIYIDPVAEPVSFLFSLVDRATALWLGLWTPLPADVSALPEHNLLLRFLGGWHALVWTALAYPLLARDPVARFWFAGSALSLLPVLAAGAQNRLLLFAGIGAIGFLVQWVFGIVRKADWAPSNGLWRPLALGVATLTLLSHLLLAPLEGLLLVEFQNRSSSRMAGAIDSVPSGALLRDRNVLILNAPDYVYLVSAIRPRQGSEGLESAERIIGIAPGEAGMTLRRDTPCSFEISLPLGLFPTVYSRYFRSSNLPFQVGQSVELSTLTASIVSKNANGEPDRIRYEFGMPLDDPSLLWLEYVEGEFVKWVPPLIGQQILISAQPGIFDW
ncbi:MAG: hypothetical protein HRT77_04295 [Halioglobus sp.]|nr:hypothetical protein [Halioglobus sp.]